MRAGRTKARFCKVKHSVICVLCATVGLETLGSLTVAQDTSPRNRILLMYGDGRVEYYPPANSAREQVSPTRHLPAADPYPADRSVSHDPVIRGRGDGKAGKDSAFQSQPAVSAEPSRSGTFEGFLEWPPQGGIFPRNVHPLRQEQGRVEPFQSVPAEEVHEPLSSYASVAVEKADEPAPSKVPPLREPIAPVALVEESDSSPGWLAMGLVQVVGTLVGLLIGLLMGAIILVVVFRRFGGKKLGPIIRVEISNPSLPADSVRSSGLTGEKRENCLPAPDVSVPIADFGDQCIPFRPPGGTYDEQQRAKTERTKRQQKQIMKQIFEKNLALREKMSRLMPVA